MDLHFKRGLSNSRIIFVVSIVFLLILLATYGTQYFIDRDIVVSSKGLADRKTEYEISKLDAEISRIRSDTAGSLFWLKLIALFVTVGGAIGGYLVGQSRSTQAKLNFEDRKNVDEVYQSIVRELAGESPILRAAAAVKLGSVLRSFPSEWNISDVRKEQLFQLTKQVLAAALSIETDKKVLKTLAINLILHKPESDSGLASVQEMDLSGAKAEGAYWARCNFEYADFYAADLSSASFRKSNLSGAQFRESNLTNAVLAESFCTNTNFKMADLRGASFEKASLNSVNFEYAKVHSVSLTDAHIEKTLECQVDISEKGDASQLISVSTWLDSMKGDSQS
ncbi:MAG: pentapeptide repeat-containing protein [Deltaproteobacteria bacterium]|nr:pentapeptide repeat-containing protein [Deltaproteobacteria bacterium]